MSKFKHWPLILLVTPLTYFLYGLTSNWLFQWNNNSRGDTLFLFICLNVTLLPGILLYISQIIERKSNHKIAFTVPIAYLFITVVFYLKAYLQDSFDIFELPNLKYVGAAIALISSIFAFIYYVFTRTRLAPVFNALVLLINVTLLAYLVLINA